MPILTAATILIINGGSSSIKFAIYEGGAILKRGLHGQIDRIGLPTCALTYAETDRGSKSSSPAKAADLQEAGAFLANWFEKRSDFAQIKAIGHRIVYGLDHSRPALINEDFHLGNGCSMTAIHDRQPIDTSMGFTPAGGLPMGTRSGDLDPGVAWWLMQQEGLSPAQFNDVINHQSGLLGISETSSDMEELLKKESVDERAAEAVALFCYQVKKWMGAYIAALGGLDLLAFTGGIGENAATVRSRICVGLDFLGIELDEERNQRNDLLISADSGRILVYVIPSDEESMIAGNTASLLQTTIHDP